MIQLHFIKQLQTINSDADSDGQILEDHVTDQALKYLGQILTIEEVLDQSTKGSNKERWA